MVKDTFWWDCDPCGYCFTHLKDRGTHHKFELVLGDWCCALNIYSDLNVTVLTAFHTTYGLTDTDTSHDHGFARIEIPYAMKGITPTNLPDKIKLIMVFS
jgi:hypothetical protein